MPPLPPLRTRGQCRVLQILRQQSESERRNASKTRRRIQRQHIAQNRNEKQSLPPIFMNKHLKIAAALLVALPTLTFHQYNISCPPFIIRDIELRS